MNHLNNDELNELIDGRLSESKKKMVSAHLEECRACASAYRQFRSIDRGARCQLIEKPSSAFVDTLMRKLDPRIAHESRIERVMKYTANFFALLIVACLIYGIVFLVTTFVPGDSSLLTGMKGIPEISTVYTDVLNVWNSFLTNVNRASTSVTPQGKIPLWLYGVWSIIMVAIVEKIAGKRLRQLSHYR
jgi:hypothetical protein